MRSMSFQRYRSGGVQKPPPFGRPEGRAPPPPLHPWTALPAQRLCSRKRRGESRPSAGLGAEPRPHRSARGRLCLCPRARYAACGQTHPPTGSTPPTLVKKTLKSPGKGLLGRFAVAGGNRRGGGGRGCNPLRGRGQSPRLGAASRRRRGSA